MNATKRPLSLIERCPRCGVLRLRRSCRSPRRHFPRWSRNALDVINAANQVQVASTGKVQINPSGQVIIGGTTCCCPPTCEGCSGAGSGPGVNCCFSSDSTITLAWSLVTTSSSSGDAAVDWQTHSKTGLAFVSFAGNIVGWDVQEGSGTTLQQYNTIYRCSSTQWQFNVQLNNVAGKTGYDIVDAGNTGGDYAGVDCCGMSKIVTMVMAHTVNGVTVGTITGDFQVTLTVNNNRCCRSGLSCITGTTVCADGTCVTPP